VKYNIKAELDGKKIEGKMKISEMLEKLDKLVVKKKR